MTFKKPAICWHSDTDEAFLVGTKESFIYLAKQLMDLVHSECEASDITGVKILTPKKQEYITEYGLDIVVQGANFVENEADMIKVANYFRLQNGNPPLVNTE